MEADVAPLILIVDDDTEIRYSLHRVLSARGFNVLTASGGREGIELARQHAPQVIFLDNRMQGITGIETLQHLRTAAPTAMTILMTAFGTTQTAIEAMKFGAFDYIVKPFDVKKVLSLVDKAVRAHQDLAQVQNTPFRPLLNSDDYKEGLVGSSEPMQEVFKVIGQVAGSEVTVMITGESGTGKELVARSIWQHSHRSEKPFLAVNCAAIPDNLIESELFGHERGSFTGATQQRSGKFELADGGTLFLDEIGDMALPTQTKILRALQEGEIQRVGGNDIIKVDVRLLAATNKDLEKLVADGDFREDLYYRLNVMRIRLPSLRERAGDVPALTDFMLQRLHKARRVRARRISPEALHILVRYPWPGNVRELENVVQRAAVVAQGETILPKDLPAEVRAHAASVEAVIDIAPAPDPAPDLPQVFGSAPPLSAPPAPPAPAPVRPPLPFTPVSPAFPDALVSPPMPSTMPAAASAGPGVPLDDAYDVLYARLREEVPENILEHIEKEMVTRVLRDTGGNQVRASTVLGITRATLRKRIDQWSLRI